MYSMTGYGKAEYNDNGISLIVEIKTVNNRNFDLNCKMPRAFIALEDTIRKTVQGYINRGRIDLFVNFSDMREGSQNFLGRFRLTAQKPRFLPRRQILIYFHRFTPLV